VLGGLQWKVTQTGPQLAATLNALGQVNEATVKTLKEANDLVKVAKAKDFPITIHHNNYCHWTDLISVTWTDAAQGDRPDGKSTGGYVSGFANKHHIDSNDWTPSTLIGWNTSKLPRVAQSCLSAETQQAAISEDEAFLIRLMWGELNGATGSHDEIANKSPAYLVVDAKALYDACLNSETSALGLREKRTGIELLGWQENLERNRSCDG